jgi:hypothetical protein
MNYSVRRSVFTALILACSCSLFGCAALGPDVGANGIIYNNTTLPNYPAPTAGNGSLAVGDTSLVPTKGVARTHDVLGLVSWGDAGVRQAAVNGDVTQIKTIDVGTYNILGIYTERTTEVSGLGHHAAPNGVNYYPPGQ